MALSACAARPVIAPEQPPVPPLPLDWRFAPLASTPLPPPSTQTVLPLCSPGRPAGTVDCSNDALGPRMSFDQLQNCATQALTLRRESMRLMQLNGALAVQRNAINQRGAAMAAGNRLPHEVAQQFEQERLAFNAQADQFGRQVLAIGQLRSTYERSCSRRPYRRSDLASLSPELQIAMRMGLDDVTVPMLATNEAPFAASDAQPRPNPSPDTGPQLQRISR
ncbi:hypothetical protein [Hydrocarboniphaga effusa]|uniref:hypothetical protein n=1 Tax=Hydrocarboniphaga effusa TaxID=243629 RepID=UPI003BA9C004